MMQRLRVFVALAEDLELASGIHVAVHNQL